MRHVVHHRPAPAPLPPFAAWLRGVVEFLALARSRWSRRGSSNNSNNHSKSGNPR